MRQLRQLPLVSDYTNQLLEQYIDEHLTEDELVDPAASYDLTMEMQPESFVHFKVGPFQFVVQAASCGQAPSLSAPHFRIKGVELVPERYREQLSRVNGQGGDTVSLREGAIEIMGCTRYPDLALFPTNIIHRVALADAPWIVGSLQQPPSFLLDCDALQLHFG